jgi:rod shape-determining protein MreC
VATSGHKRFSIDAESASEVAFLLILIWMLAGPVSGAVLTVHTWVSAIFTKSAHQLESTKILAEQVIESSARIKYLEKKLADTEMELTKYRQQSKDTDQLRSLLGLRQRLDRTTIAADVITRNPDNWFEQVTVDRGKFDNVAPGSGVITNDGVVGQVISVSDRASVIRLLTDPGQKMGVVIKRIGQPGVLSGRHQGPAVIDFVPVGTAVDVGDEVISLGNGGVFPSDHPVGVITGVRRDKNGTTLSIEVKPSANFYDLRQVLIVPAQGLKE